MNNPSNNSEIKRLASDLHEALKQVPLDTAYFDKMNLYSKILIEDYNWNRVEIYSTHEQLDALAAGARVTTSNNSLAIKHDTGWIILTTEGYIFSRNGSDKLALPVFSIPVNTYHSADSVTLNDSAPNGTQIT